MGYIFEKLHKIAENIVCSLLLQKQDKSYEDETKMFVFE